MKKTILIVLAIVIIAALAYVVVMKKNGSDYGSPYGSNSEANDTSAAVNAELEIIDLGDLDKEFESIDKDLNTL